MHRNPNKMISFKGRSNPIDYRLGWLEALVYLSGTILIVDYQTLSISLSLYQPNERKKEGGIIIKTIYSYEEDCGLRYIYLVYIPAWNEPPKIGERGQVGRADAWVWMVRKEKARATHFHMHDACMSLLLVLMFGGL
ncbi:hypothetical protein TWF970_000401 [Orbilia oligospora]|nr:hypothetical protein TWF970_000401 [Orbilia oligospora]